MLGQGGLVLWFSLVALSVGFVVVDLWTAPVNLVLKWAFIILAVFTGPFAAFFYVLGCREPLKDTHSAYVAVRWRQVLGSTMHCAAGDGIGIIAGAALAAYLQPSAWVDLPLEYLLGFGFGWMFFQAFAMRDMAGGSYLRSLRQTFLPEFLSMNLLMAGMVPAIRLVMPHVVGGADPLSGGFWFVMSMALIVGFVLAYPVNWWLVARGLKHGMITSPPPSEPGQSSRVPSHPQTSWTAKMGMILLTVGSLALSIALTDRLIR
jgi:hypothetical protein